MVRIVEYCKSRKLPLIIGSDSNSHCTAWGSRETNKRGQELAEYLSTTDLQILNEGEEPTFVTSRSQQIIDITLANRMGAPLVSNWRVDDADSMSDHRYICFDVAVPKMGRVEYRNPKATDWIRYQQQVQHALAGYEQQRIPCERIEASVNSLQKIVVSACNSACPLRVHKADKRVPWWSKELTRLRRESRLAYRQARLTQQPEAWRRYRHPRNVYGNEIRSCQRKAWATFCSSVHSTAESARISKVLGANYGPRLGMLQTANGEFTKDFDEVLCHMLDTHFPGCVLVQQGEDTVVTPTGGGNNDDSYQMAQRFITTERIRWAIESFAPFKMAGIDGIFPRLLQSGLPWLVRPLKDIFCACLEFGYVPYQWREVNVVFLPKPGKDSYTSAKSFRPISITSFMLKTLEKLIDRYIRETVLISRPLHQNQHAYQAGKSTETALHQLVSRIEVALDQGQYAMCAFLDIEGAFDKPVFTLVMQTLQHRGVETSLCDWILGMLRGRRVRATCGQSTQEANVTRGVGQGAVLSPLLWCFYVDELLVRLETAHLYAQAYSDDIVVFVRGQFIDTVRDRIQQALNIVQRWCAEVHLGVNPKKTELVVFTRRRKLDGYRPPRLCGVQLELTSEVKYLGVILDSKLTFANHVQQKCCKALKAYWQCRRAIGSKWGLRPRVVHWLYTAVIRPMLSYAAVVWWPRTGIGTARLNLTRVQRQFCLAIAGCMRTTPTAALEIILDLPPLHIHIEREALAAACRLVRNGQLNADALRRGHMSMLNSYADPESGLSRLGWPSDYLQRTFIFSRNFEVRFPTREEWASTNEPMVGTVNCWTDGSRDDDGNAGCGFYVCDQWGHTEQSTPLGRHATVFQAEIMAILQAAEHVAQCTHETVCIFSDSRSALMALAAFECHSQLVYECVQRLSTVGEHNELHIVWVPGHRGIAGNEVADRLAKQGAARRMCGPEPAVGLPQKALQMDLRRWTAARHQEWWTHKEGCRQAKDMVTFRKPMESRWLLCRSRQEVQTVVGLLTGHLPLARHLYIMSLSDQGNCPYCDPSGFDVDTEEDVVHFLAQCPSFMAERMAVFGRPILDPFDLPSISWRDLQKYAVRTRRFARVVD
jgi:ribonuclease HI